MNPPTLLRLTEGSSRRCPLRMPEGWQPPVPAWCGALSALNEPVVAFLGVQSAGGGATRIADDLHERIGAAGARVERASHVDAAGFGNDVLVCYWKDQPSYDEWSGGEFGRWWSDPARLTGDVGYWREVFTAPADHRETLFSGNDRPAGLAALGTGFLGPVAEHGYWGGSRDRIPATARHDFSVERTLERTERRTRGRRLHVSPPEHLCIIRSAQDSTDCSGREAELFDGSVFPVLEAGMTYLGGHAEETGCYSCRLLAEAPAGTSPRTRTFAIAQFVSLGHLERWASSHATHLAIFDRFLEMAGELGPAMRLRLWHEIFVVPGGAGRFEYLNCHPGTGLLPFVEAIDVT